MSAEPIARVDQRNRLPLDEADGQVRADSLHAG
jgi:hypothetical protein